MLVLCISVSAERDKRSEGRESMCFALLRGKTPSGVGRQTVLLTLFESAQRCAFPDTADVTLTLCLSSDSYCSLFLPNLTHIKQNHQLQDFEMSGKVDANCFRVILRKYFKKINKLHICEPYDVQFYQHVIYRNVVFLTNMCLQGARGLSHCTANTQKQTLAFTPTPCLESPT